MFIELNLTLCPYHLHMLVHKYMMEGSWSRMAFCIMISKANLKFNGDSATPCFNPLSTANKDKFLFPTLTELVKPVFPNKKLD